ncbi:hypothetical protein AAMO2058_001585400 [Amorphochlora amoebiformis]
MSLDRPLAASRQRSLLLEQTRTIWLPTPEAIQLGFWLGVGAALTAYISPHSLLLTVPTSTVVSVGVAAVLLQAGRHIEDVCCEWIDDETREDRAVSTHGIVVWLAALKGCLCAHCVVYLLVIGRGLLV